MEKERRQQHILNLITAHRIGTQQELAARLERAGVVATQSSISRDLEELGIVKDRGRYALPRVSRAGMAPHGLLSVEVAGSCLVVAKCESGMASAVAVVIDRAALDEIVGTIAGEDTVFIAVQDKKSQRAAMKKVWEMFQ
ncbi:MAG TPA: hypothetical protein VF666_16800 [Pyrinomonadaceae bacterium]|jgi:transcriptional regulator of arginine metabolism